MLMPIQNWGIIPKTVTKDGKRKKNFFCKIFKFVKYNKTLRWIKKLKS